MPDTSPTPPEDWRDIPLGAGQNPGPLAHLQHNDRNDPRLGADVRRHPDYKSLKVSVRYPERPA